MKWLLVQAFLFGLVSVPNSANAGKKYELGPCLDESRPISVGSRLSIKAEDEARKNKNWDLLIEADKRSVRENCKVPYRWERLFLDLVLARRFNDAASLLDQLKNYKVFLPYAIVDKAGKEFLDSSIFADTEYGKQFRAKRAAYEAAFAAAGRKLNSMGAKELPPSPFRRSGACPFECCQFGKWKTRSAVKLYDNVGSSKIVADIPAGREVLAVTGEVVLDPVPYAVLETHGDLKSGDVLFLLDNIGEGAVHIWYGGKEDPELKGTASNLESESISSLVSESCQSNAGQECWLKMLHPEKKTRNEWWVKVKTAAGITGWSRSNGQFEGTDSCG